MKPVKMFVMASCPHCVRAKAWMDEVLAEHPEYRQIELTVIDERDKREIADAHDYWYVPTYYVGDEKKHEGVASKKIVQGIFEHAYAG